MKKHKRAKARKIKRPPLSGMTFLISSVILLVYLALSKALLYIPTKDMLRFGFSFSNPLGIISYAFMHIGPTHLIGNLLLLIPIGLIAEKKLRRRDFFAVFFISSAAAGITFSLLVPETILVGASAAISGLIAAAFMVDIKKAFVAIILFSIVITLVAPPITDWTNDRYTEMRVKAFGLEKDIEKIDVLIETAEKEMDVEAVEQYTEEKKQTVETFSKIKEEEVNLEIGLVREKEVKTSPIVHLVGAIAGFIYLFIFRRDIIWEMPSQVIPQKYL